MWCFIGWCTCVCIHVVLLVVHYQFGAVFPSDVEPQNINQVCMYRSHWNHNSQSDFVNCTQSCTVTCFFINYIAVNCGTPSSLSNGQRRYSSTTFGSRVTYTCNTGYLRTAGSSSRTCQSNGQWSGSHPTCTRKSTLSHYISSTYRLLTYERIAIIYLIFTPFQFIS